MDKSTHNINGEQTFPIYEFKARWSQDGDQNDRHPNWYKGLPKGRIWNSMSHRFILKEEISDAELQKKAKDWYDAAVEEKNKNSDEKLRIINPEIDYLKGELIEYEVWCLTWFQHETFDVGKSDQEVLDSFEKYVDRKSRNRDEYGEISPTLMGAEDRWRWCGSGNEGKSEDRTPPPCRCKFCKEQGKVRIGH